MKEDPVMNSPIRSLQLMLRAISFVNPEIPKIIPDGIFGEATAGAVAAFQRMAGLPVTGVADMETFQAIVAAYDRATELLSAAEAPVLLFPAELVVQPKQSHPTVFMVQVMMAALHPKYQEILLTAITGQLDDTTVKNLKLIQSLAALPVTGALDLRTYNILSRLYRSTFDRGMLPSYG